MKPDFLNDYPSTQLSKYFLRFVDKVCKKLDFNLLYNPKNNDFIVSDTILKEQYKDFKTLEQIKFEKPIAVFYTDNYNWQKKPIILFNKEEPYEDNNGEYNYPDLYECNHSIQFKMSMPNLQKLLLCIFKNPILQAQYYNIQDTFSEHIYDLKLYFPSENMDIDSRLDLLLIRNLDQKVLTENMLKMNPVIIEILKKKSGDYLVEFFNSFGKQYGKEGMRADIKFKDFIFAVTNNEEILSRIFENFPEFIKFLTKNTPDNFLTKETQLVTISKSFFNIENLSIKYHDKFTLEQTKTCLLNILNDSSFNKILAEKNIHVYSAFYDYNTKSVISIIEKNSILPTEKIENFFCESINHIKKKEYSTNYMENNKENIHKFFNYFYLNEVSEKKNNPYSKSSLSKI